MTSRASSQPTWARATQLRAWRHPLHRWRWQVRERQASRNLPECPQARDCRRRKRAGCCNRRLAPAPAWLPCGHVAQSPNAQRRRFRFGTIGARLGPAVALMSRPAVIPSGSWPRRMCAELAAGYCGEPSAEAFIARVGKEYPQPRVNDGRRRLWLKDDLDRAILPPDTRDRDAAEDL